MNLVTGVKGVAGDSAMQLQGRLRPGDDVTGHVTAAGGQTVDVVAGKDVGPHLQVGDLAHECLGGVKSTAECVLRGEQDVLFPITAGFARAPEKIQRTTRET